MKKFCVAAACLRVRASLTDSIFRYRVSYFSVFAFLFLFFIESNVIAQCSVNAGNDTVICQNKPLIRTATVSPVTSSIQWYQLGNSTNILSTTAILNTTPTVADTFFYIIKITSGSGASTCIDLDTFRVIVRPSPRVNAGANQTVCQASPLSLNATVSPSSATVNWYAVGSTTSLANTTSFPVPTGAAGTFNYYIKADSANSCSTNDTVQVVVNSKPNASFTFTTNCGRNYSFTSTSSTSTGSITNYCWNFGTGSGCQSTSANPNFRYPRGSSGQSFTVRLIVTNNFGCKDTVTQNITIGVSPFAQLSSEQPTTTINGDEYFFVCTSGDSTFTFYNNSLNFLAATSYNINWGDGTSDSYTQTTFPAPISSGATVSHNYLTGIYTLTFTMNNNNGCVDSVKYKVYVGNIPAGGIVGLPASTICAGNQQGVVISGTASNTAGTIYSLSYNDGTDSITLIAPIPDPDTLYHTFNTSSCGTTSTTGGSTYGNAFGAYLNIRSPCGNRSGSVVPIYVASSPLADFEFSPYDSICIGQTLTLTNTSISGQNNVNGVCTPGKSVWQILPNTPGTRFAILNSGTLGTIVGTNPTNWTEGSNILNVRFDSAGIYTIRIITANNQLCGRDTMVKTICVNPIPTASFALSTNLGCTPLPVIATGSTNIPTCGQNTYNWTVTYTPTPGCTPNVSDYAYVNGTNASSPNPQFSFVSPGMYTIGLQTFSPNSRCSSVVVTQQVTVKGKPVVSVLSPAASLCEDGSISFSAISTCYIDASTTYQWNFDNGVPGTSNLPNPPPITFATPGTETIGLTVTNSCGPTQASTNITIHPLPTISGPSSVCVGSSIQLNGATSATGVSSWNTSNAGVATVSATGLVTGVSSGVASISFTDGNGCIQSVNVTVNPLPSITGYSPICVGNTLTLTGSATASGTTPWLSGTPSVASISNTGVVTAVSSGTSIITYTNSNGCQNTLSFVVNPLPTITGNTTLCLNATSVLNGTGTPSSNPVAWSSSVPAVATITSAGSVTALSPGTTTITYTDNNGCVKTAVVTVKPLPVITGSTSICVGSVVTYNGTGNPSSSNPWVSSDGNVATISGTGIVTGVGAGSTVITYTDEFGCQATLAVTVSSSPTATITYPSTICTNQTGQSVTLTGASGGTFSIIPPTNTGLSLNTTTGALNPSTSTPGTYTVNYNLPAGNGCAAVDISTSVTITATPTAPLASNNGVLCSGSTLQLTTSYTGAGTPVWSWTGPNLFSSNLEDPSIPSAGTSASGTYSVTVTVDGCTSPAGTTTVVVYETPATPAAGSNSPVCSGNPLNLTASTTSTMPVSWSWTGPLGYGSTIQNPQVSPTATSGMSGSYSVTATATYVNPAKVCVSLPGAVPVVVNPTPAIGDTSSSGPTACATATGSISLTGLTASTSYEVHYTGPTGAVTTNITTSGTGQLIIPNLPAGTYDPVFVVLNGCPSNQVGPFSLSDPNPPAAPLVTPSITICDGESIQLSASTPASGTATWSWTGPNSYTSNQANPLINPANTSNTGGYSVTVTINSCTSPSSTTSVVVNPRPAAPVVSSPVTYCQFASSQPLSATPLSGHTLVWYASATATTPIPVPTPATATAGTTSYFVSQISPENCEGIRSQIDVVVNPTPVVPDQPLTVCSGASFQITPSGTGIPVNTVYSWPAPVVTGGLTGGASGTSAPLISGALSNPGDLVQTATYTVTPVSGSCTGDDFTALVTVNPAPRVNFAPAPQTICSGQTTAAVILSSPTPDVDIPWVAQVPPGITGAQLTGTNSVPAMTLLNTTSTVQTVILAAVAITTGATGCPGDTSRYNLIVQPRPSIPDQNLSVCSRDTLRFSPADAPPSVLVPSGTLYTWTFTDNPAITGESAQGVPVDEFVQGLVNTSAVVQQVEYVVTPVSDNCTGAPFRITVSVNPRPEIPSLFDTVCSAQSFTVIPAQGIQGAIVPGGTTYSWSAPALPAGMGGAASGTASADISGTLTNTTFAPLTVSYLIQPVSGLAGNCPGDTFRVFITVNPLASISNNPLSQSVCTDNTTQPVSWTSFTAGASYTWTLVSSGNVTGFLPSGSGTQLADMTLVNSGIATDSVVYAVTSTASACAGPATPYTIYVHPDARADFDFPEDTACWPYLIVINNTSAQSPGNPNIPNGSYEWYSLYGATAPVFLGNGTAFPGFTIPGPSDSIRIKLKAVSAFGCRNDSLSHVFRTKPSPAALFNMSNRDSCGPLTVRFTNQTPLRDTFQYLWQFGNGQSSTQANPDPVTFLSSPVFLDTTYYVTLTAYNACDTSVYRDSVIVRADPKALFSVTSTSGCSPFTIQITNSSLGNAYEYYWDFGNGDRDTTFANGTFSYTYFTSVIDTFDLRLIAQNQCGRDTQVINIRVAPNTIRPGITINATDLFGCVSHTVDFLNSTTGATSFTWDFGDGTSPVTTSLFQNVVQHVYQTAGTFTVTIDMTNGCSDTTVYKQITVYPSPSASFTTAPVICQGDTVRVTNTSQQASGYIWSWGDGITNSGFSPTHVYATAGNYTIQLLVQQTAPTGVVCEDTVSRPVTVLVKPDTTLITNIGSPNCAPFLLNASVPGIINETVNWYVFDTAVSSTPVVITGPTLQYTFNQQGMYEVLMVAVNAAGCQDSTRRRFYVYQKPVAAFNPLQVVTCNLDTSITHTNTSTANNYTPLTYRWKVDGIQRATSGNFTYRYATPPATLLPRIFQTQLIVTNSVGCADSISGSVHMNPTAKSLFQLQNPSDCLPFTTIINNQSQYAESYNWFLNGVLVSQDPSPAIPITLANTSYTLTLVVSNSYACRPDTSRFTFRTRIMPVARFRLSDSLGCTGQLNVGTTNQSLNANAYTWEWGDGTPNSTTANPTHLYTSVGQYRIVLTASDGTCRDTTSRLVTVARKPMVNFVASNARTCDTARIQLINLTTQADGYLWVLSNGFTSTELSPWVSLPPSNTPYTVQLVAFNNAGCRDSLTRPNYIRAIVPPRADFQVLPSMVIQIPNYSFSFTNLTPNNPYYRYIWTLGDGAYALTRDVVTHQYPDTGSYTVSMSVLDTSTNCLDTMVKVVRIEGAPGYLYVPNAFYPNSIQTQFRYFRPLGKGLESYELQIYDNWGKLLFRSNKLDASGIPVEGWDGTYQGKPMPQDAYAWRIKARFRNGKEWSGMSYDQNEQGAPGHTFGTVTLFR